MIGIFDSGVGGFNALYEIRRASPRADVIYLADRSNSPYGTKGEEVLCELVERDIKTLRGLGASRILIACCTASTVYPRLDESDRRISLPIITPAALATAKYKRVAVIATDATVRSGAFGREIRRINPDSTVTEIAAQRLVALVENGARDGRINRECENLLDSLAIEIRDLRADALVLGCTHFSHLEAELAKRLHGVKIISPAREGARALLSENREDIIRGSGKTLYIET